MVLTVSMDKCKSVDEDIRAAVIMFLTARCSFADEGFCAR